jgi:cytochrome c553
MLLRAMSKGIGDRKPTHIMRAIALSLSDEEIATVARYLVAMNK